jgi:hypothetical protein
MQRWLFCRFTCEAITESFKLADNLLNFFHVRPIEQSIIYVSNEDDSMTKVHTGAELGDFKIKLL